MQERDESNDGECDVIADVEVYRISEAGKSSKRGKKTPASNRPRPNHLNHSLITDFDGGELESVQVMPPPVSPDLFLTRKGLARVQPCQAACQTVANQQSRKYFRMIGGYF